MTKLELFSILFTVEDIKEIKTPKTNKLMKHLIDIGKIFGGWFGISNRKSWWSTADLTISGGVPFRTNTHMSRARFEGILGFIRYTDKMILNIMMSSSTCAKWKNRGTLTWLKSLIHNGLIYLTKV